MQNASLQPPPANPAIQAQPLAGVSSPAKAPAVETKQDSGSGSVIDPSKCFMNI